METPVRKILVRTLLIASLLFVQVVQGAPLGGLEPTDEPFAGSGPWMVRAWFGDELMLREVAAWGDHYRYHRDKGFLAIEADTSRVAALQALGFYVEVDEELTSWIRHAERAQRLAAERAERGEAPEAGIPGFPCYRTVEETFASAQALAAAHPTLATIVDAGNSWEKATAGGLPGYDMLVLKLTNSGVPGPKPKLFATTAIHAREYTTAELAMRFAEGLVDGYGIDADATWLLDHHEIHLMLHTNPDGRKHAESSLWWRKNTNENYCGATSDSRGADLNRNFEFQWGVCSASGCSSTNPCSETYRGASAASEPEVQAVQAYLQANFPDQRLPGLNEPAPPDATGVYLDIHSYSELVLWSWGFTSTPPPNATALTTLGRKFAYFNGYYPEQSIGLYPTDGTTDDFGYGDLGVAAYTFELGTEFFQSCSFFESAILPGNLPALRYAAKVARTPYRTPAGPDAVAVAAVPGVIAPGDPVDVTATLDETRYSSANGAEPVQPIAAAELYLAVPPWAGGTPVAMSADDGAWNETVEAATATLDGAATAALASGRHLVYVRGRDNLNNWGAVSAAFLTVIDPATAPIVSGTVTEAGTGTPLAATVAVGPFATATDPGTGAYSIQVPEGTYDIAASAPGHATVTAAGVALASQQTWVQDFVLQAYAIVLDDDVEGGNIGWSPGSPAWSITTSSAHSPTHSWTDSVGNYIDNVDTSLTSPLLDLTGGVAIQLSFWHRYDTEATWDFCHVEVSANNGTSWTEVAVYDGNQPSWQAVTLAVPQLDGAAQARVRFRLSTDGSIVRDGWYVDDIVLAWLPPQAPQAMTVAVVGAGTVTSSPPGISCPSDCSESFAYGTPVLLSAAPAVGWAFTGWTGDCAGAGSCNLTMSVGHAVTATFAPADPMPFLDGFESGDMLQWSLAVP